MATKNNSIQAKLEAMQRKASTLSKTSKREDTHLATVKHKQKDFFIADLFDTVRFKDDIASMEYPLFALKAGDTRDRTYQHDNTTIIVAPNAKYGMATIHDKDIWLYCISKLTQAINDGKEINRTVRFTIYDYLVTTNRLVNGKTYGLTKDALDRLQGTSISIERIIDNRRIASGFGLVDDWTIVEEKDGRMLRVEVTLPKWLYQSITERKVLTISPDYFRLRKPLDRRVYELARKHCGNNKQWLFNLDTLHKKTGATSKLFEFRRAIKSLAESDELPDYYAHYMHETDQILFKPREVQQELLD